MTLPSFTPQEINKEQLYRQFGSLSALSIKTKDDSIEECSNTMDNSGEKSCFSVQPLIDEPHVITGIMTKYGIFSELFSVSCLSDRDMWIFGSDKFMSLYSLRGELLKSVGTKSENRPYDIAVT